MEQALRAQHQQPGQAFEEERASKLMLQALWAHSILGRSWEAVAAGNGLVLTTDLVHLNSHGAAIIADLIERWLPAPTAAPVA